MPIQKNRLLTSQPEFLLFVQRSQIIEDFFIDKVQEAISTGFDDILKPIRDKKKNHKHKEYLEKCTKEEEALESNQWMRKKLDTLAVFFGADEKLSELIGKIIDLYQEPTDQNELKTNLATQFKSLKKEMNKSQLSEQDKKSFEKIETEKLQPDKFKKINGYLKDWRKLIPKYPLRWERQKRSLKKNFKEIHGLTRLL